jgi:hypothetical protein
MADEPEVAAHSPNPTMHGPAQPASAPTEVVSPPKSFMDISVDDVMRELDNDELRGLVTRGFEAGKHYAEFVRLGTAVVRDVLDLWNRVQGGGGNSF